MKGSGQDTTTATGAKGKVKFMVKNILYADQIKNLKAKGFWYV